MKYIKAVIAALFVINFPTNLYAEKHKSVTPTEQALVENALNYLGVYFLTTIEIVQDGTGTSSIVAPKISTDVRVDITLKAMHAFILKEILKEMYEKKFNGECEEDSDFENLLSELSVVSEPLLSLGAHFHRNGIEKNIMEEMYWWSGENSEELVKNAVARSISISLEITNCPEFYKNIREWISLYKEMDASNQGSRLHKE